MANSQEIVKDIADALQKAPANVDEQYVNILARSSSYLGNPSLALENIRKTSLRSQLPYVSQAPGSNPWGNVGRPYDLASYEVIRNGAMAARNNIFDVVNSVNSFVARARNAGFSPPANPFSVIANLNAKRVGFAALKIDQAQADELVLNMGKFVDLLKAEREGKINLDTNLNHAAQLSSAHVSFEGLGGSGNPAVDLMQFLPDMDMIKEKRAEKTLQVLDFSKRVPKVIFTANYAPDGITKGSVVGWQKIADASGYVIKRKNIFDGSEVAYTISNDELNVRWKHIRDYVKAWVLTFYDNIDQQNVTAFLDGEVEPNAYYTYRIQAYQTRKETKGTLFNVKTTPFKVISKDRLIRDFNEQTSRDGSISPYPLLAQLIMGDPQYDWILAGVNVRASIVRGDTRTDTRRYSYITAQLPFLLEQMEKEKFVFPKNVSDVVRNVSDSISQFGCMQTIQEILQETGVLYYFDGNDARENPYFSKIDVADENDSGFLSTVVAAIDPETATMDLGTLAMNIPKLLAGGVLSQNELSSQLVKTKKDSSPSEIEISNDVSNPSSRPEDEVQFLRKLDGLDKTEVDLTTFDGVSKFVRTVRIFSDTGPYRGSGIIAKPILTKPDPIPEPLPSPPPRPVISPNVVQQQAVEAAQNIREIFSRPVPVAFDPYSTVKNITEQLAIALRQFNV